MSYFDFSTNLGADQQLSEAWNFRLQLENSPDALGIYIRMNSKEPHKLYLSYKDKKELLLAHLKEMIIAKGQELDPAYRFNGLGFTKITMTNIVLTAYFTFDNHT